MLTRSKRAFYASAMVLSVTTLLWQGHSQRPVGSFPILPYPPAQSILSDRRLKGTYDLLALPSGDLVAANPVQNALLRLVDRRHIARLPVSFGQGPGEIDEPYRVQGTKDGSIAVLESANHRIQWLAGHQFTRSAAALPFPVSGWLNAFALLPNGVTYVGCSTEGRNGTSVSLVLAYDTNDHLLSKWDVPEYVVDIRPEIKGRIWVVTSKGPNLYTPNGRLVRRLALPRREDMERAVDTMPVVPGQSPTASLRSLFHVPRISYHPHTLCQTPDGRVYLSAGSYLLVYDRNYEPVGAIPASSFTGMGLPALLVDRTNCLWAVDDFGTLMKLPLPSRV